VPRIVWAVGRLSGSWMSSRTFESEASPHRRQLRSLMPMGFGKLRVFVVHPGKIIALFMVLTSSLKLPAVTAMAQRNATSGRPPEHAILV